MLHILFSSIFLFTLHITYTLQYTTLHKQIPWRVVVVDEAHRLRNTNSKLLECMRSVVAKGLTAYGYQHRILMTGMCGRASGCFVIVFMNGCKRMID